MKAKMIAGIALIIIGGITLLTGGFRSAVASKAANIASTQSAQVETGHFPTREVLTSVCLLGGVGLVIASVLKK